jgi:uncharacterized membrane protein
MIIYLLGSVPLTFLIFLILKLTHVINWNWIWIFSPFLTLIGVILILVALIYSLSILDDLKIKKLKKKILREER